MRDGRLFRILPLAGGYSRLMARKRPVHPPAPRISVNVSKRDHGQLQNGELVQLTDPRGTKKTITLIAGSVLHTHRGQLLHDEIIGLDEGSCVTSTRNIGFVVQRPTLDDYVLGMPRQAAVIYPKEAARIVTLCDLAPGSSVLEAGVGSGALTCYLLRACGPEGIVTSFERRSDFAETARENVCRWFGGLPKSWQLIGGDVQDWTSLGDQYLGAQMDAVVFDMLAPWECLKAAREFLRPGGNLVCYVATTTQLSRLVETLRESGTWTEPRAEESLLRTWHLDGLSVRPDHRMNGHTGFLVSCRAMAPGHLTPQRARRPAPGAYGDDYRGPGGMAVRPPDSG